MSAQRYYVTALSDTHGRVVWHEEEPVTLLEAERLVDTLITKRDLTHILVLKDGETWEPIREGAAS